MCALAVQVVSSAKENATLTLLGPQVAGAVLEAHNQLRRHAGLPLLKWNSELRSIAEQWTVASGTALECGGILHSPKQFRTAHPSSPFYYLGETLASRRIGLEEMSLSTGTRLATDAVSRWGHSMLRNVSYGRWGSACTVSAVWGDKSLNEALAVVEGFFQSMWVETTEVGCEAAFCDNSTQSSVSTRSFMLVCEYGPGGNVIGELPFSPATATHLGLSHEPCDGTLSNQEWQKWERWDAKHYPLPHANGADIALRGQMLLLIAVLLFY